MDKRIAGALAAGTVMALPLLTACGASTAPQGSSAAPAASSAAPATGAATSAATGASTTAPSTSAASTAAATPTPTADPAKEKAAVTAASTKFVKLGLTIGYPDTHYSAYTKRLKPLMTSAGYDSLESGTTAKDGDKTLKKLDTERARTTPKIKSQKVSSVTADSAQVKVGYQSLIQQRSGGDWKTLKTQPAESVTLKLVKKGGSWLVDDAA